jgi:branched-chain amino acid transport system substrate-binding protein
MGIRTLVFADATAQEGEICRWRFGAKRLTTVRVGGSQGRARCIRPLEQSLDVPPDQFSTGKSRVILYACVHEKLSTSERSDYWKSNTAFLKVQRGFLVCRTKQEEIPMRKDLIARPVQRRTILKAGLAIGAMQVASPFVVKALAEESVKIGLNDPFTGTYAELGKNEQIGCELAIEQINAKGGILGRKVELLSEDSTSADTGTAVQKAHKLIDRDKVNFFLGNVNSAMAIALGEVTNQAGVLHVVTGGHTDSVTGTDCHWNVFRVCNTTRMETNSVSNTLFNKYGKKWYFLTPDYAFGHTLQQGFEAALKANHGTELGASLTPLGTTDYSSYLIKAQATNPDVIIFLEAGQDAVNALKQAVQFGLDKKFHLAGAQQELEVLNGLPPEARVGTWVFEWYWKQANVPHVNDFVAAIRKRNGGKVPTARHWFGFVSAWTCALAANGTKSLDARKMAKFLQNYKLPPEVALMPNDPFYRDGDNQLMPTLYVGHAQAHGKDDPEDLFVVDEEVRGVDAALPVAETGCKMHWPV